MLGYFQLILAAVILGSLGIFARIIDLPSPVLSFYRFLFGSIFLFIFFLIRQKKNKQKYIWDKKIFLQGTLTTLTVVTFFFAFAYTSVANTVILQYTAPVFVVILAYFLLHEKLEKITILSLFMSLVGVIMIASPQSINLSRELLGVIFALTSGIFYSLAILNGKILGEKYTGLEVNQTQFIIVTVILFPLLFFGKYIITIEKLILLVILGFFHTAVAFVLFFEGLKKVKAQHVGIISYFEPLSAVIFAFLFLQEIPTLYTIIGGSMILVSSYLIIKFHETK